MTNNIPPVSVPRSKSSILLPIGVVLIVLGLFLPAQLARVAGTMESGAMRSIAFVATDVFRLCFFAGIIASIIGFVRNRNSKQTTPAPSEPANR